MKRMLLVGLGLALSLVDSPGRMEAQTLPGIQPSGQQTRVALINVAMVFKDYEKAKLFKSETEKFIEPKRLLREKLAKEIIAWKQAMGDIKFDQTQKNRYDVGILNNQRQLEDLDREMRQVLSQKNEQQYVQLYKELNDAVQRYAAAHNFQVILSYIEPTQGDLYGIMNIGRKVQGMDMGGAVSALYVAPGLDISTPIVEMLNQQYRAAGGAAMPVTPVSLPK